MVFSRKDGRFTPADGLRVRAIFYASFSVIHGALVPLVLFAFKIPTAVLWPATAALHTVIGFLILSEAARFQFAMSKSERSEAGRLQNAISWGVLLCVALILMVFGYGGGASYILVLVLLLTVATTSFLSFAFQRLL